MHIKELREKSPAYLIELAEKEGIENPTSFDTQNLRFNILKKISQKEKLIGEGVLEIMPDGYGFLRSKDANYLAGQDDIYVSPALIKRNSLKNGDTVEGNLRAPKAGEKYFALDNVNTINFENPERSRHRVHFDDLTPLYPQKKLNLEMMPANPKKPDLATRIIDCILYTTPSPRDASE